MVAVVFVKDDGDMALISARDLHRVYQTGDIEVCALDGIALDINSGEVTMIIGPSGSGKSTILNILGGMDQPTSGTVICGGMHIERLSESGLTRYRREHVGFVFQFYNLIPTLTAIENVGIACCGIDDAAEPSEILSRLGLGGRGDSFPHELSGGQMQRVAIARALAKRPALLLCDEPTGALDSATGDEVMMILGEAARTYNAAVVVVTHNESYLQWADQMIRLRDGKIVDTSRVTEARRA